MEDKKMNLVRCEKGVHFYDKDKFDSCPFCMADNDAGVTMTYREPDTTGDDLDSPTVAGSAVTVPASSGNMSLNDAIKSVTETESYEDDDDDMGKTISYYNTTMGIEPVVGWLIAINGPEFGKSYEIKSGRNFIGRSKDMDISLQGDDTISRNKHAIVVYEPKSRMFIAQPGESRELFYVNDKVVLNNEQIKKNDVLLLGKTKLMLIPCCDEQFCWEDVENEK